MADSQSVLRIIQEGGMIPFNCLIKRLVAKATASQDTRGEHTGHVHNNNSSFWDSEGRREQREFTRSGRGWRFVFYASPPSFAASFRYVKKEQYQG